MIKWKGLASRTATAPLVRLKSIAQGDLRKVLAASNPRRVRPTSGSWRAALQARRVNVRARGIFKTPQHALRDILRLCALGNNRAARRLARH